nr:unnamed protein product [Callosobruchus analis]
MDLNNKTVEIKEEIEKCDKTEDTNCVKRIKDEPSTENCSEFDCMADQPEHVKIEEHAAIQIKSEETETCNDMSEDEDIPDLIHIKTETLAGSDSQLDSVTKNSNLESESDEMNSEAVDNDNCSYKTYCKNNLGNQITDYRCTQCDKSFESKACLDIHMDSIHAQSASSVSPIILKCRSCSYITSFPSDLKKHMFGKHSGESSGQRKVCIECHKGFNSKQYLDEHILRKHPKLIDLVSSKIHDCKGCNFRTTDKGRLDSHVSTHILKNDPNFSLAASSKVFECSNCDYKSAYKCNLNKHMLKHAVNKSYTCKRCNVSFERKPLLNEHIFKEHSKSRASGTSEMIQCSECFYVTLYKSNFNRHLLTHIVEVHKPFTCAHCKASFKSKLSIDDHVLKKHPNFMNSISSEIFCCTNCDFKTSRKTNLTRHMMKHVTDISSKSDETLGVTTYKCLNCTYESTTKSDVHKHMKRDHQPITGKMYECFDCTFKTARKDRLEKHVSLHRDINLKPSTCTQCNTPFKSKQALGEHIIKNHPNFVGSISCKVFECIYCVYKTTISCKFSYHKLEHTGKIFRCRYCDALFKSKHYLNDHVIKRHSNNIESTRSKVHKCEHCPYETISKSRLVKHMIRHKFVGSGIVTYHASLTNKFAAQKENWVKELHVANSETERNLYFCSNCSYSTYCQNTLINHVAAGHCSSKTESGFDHTERNEFACTHCDKSFKKKLGLEGHIVQNHTELIASVSSKIYECTGCYYKTVYISHFKRHMSQHPDVPSISILKERLSKSEVRRNRSRKIGDYVCPHCERTFKNKFCLDGHIVKVHTEFSASVSSKIHECTSCNFKTVYTTNFKRHMWKHTGLPSSNSKFYSCVQCSRTFNTKTLLDEHLLRRHPKLAALVSSKIHECTDCDYKSTNKSNFEQHRAVHNNTVYKVRKCKYCDAKFNCKPSLLGHILKQHPEFIEAGFYKVHECKNCHYKSAYNRDLKRHISRVHPDAISESISCKYCKARFKSDRLLESHIARAHLDAIAKISTQFECFNCTFKCFIKTDLESHMVKNHARKGTVKMYSCLECPFKTGMKGYLEKHVLGHRGVDSTISTCTQCKAPFMNEQIMGEHVIKDHPNFIASISCKIYECVYCAYKTTFPRKLACHEKICQRSIGVEDIANSQC